ncbi:TadE family type IV pilus minor pilin [Frankia sp. Cj3]|uniref:TadE family type IV pilus minor pilin n=1 Tax=Frankia sp. Cj3 TaxID=2880976 RepID=UPI00272E8C66|nr:TadE family type IV pilus minor pilin [Frankia sp. Cj3]
MITLRRTRSGDTGEPGLPHAAAAGSKRRTADDSGQATAELAFAIPSLILVLLISIWLVSAVAIQARCAEAARVGARAAARGETDETVRLWSGRAAPHGSEISITRGFNFVVVRVALDTHATVGIASITPFITIKASSTAPLEAAGSTEESHLDSSS